MERLTFEGDFCEIAQCLEVKGGAFCREEPCSQYQVWNRLRQYEDTGLSPEICKNYRIFEDEAISKGVTFNRIVELMESERSGLLVKLPCKIGDHAWAIRNVRGCKRAMLGVVAEMYYTQDMRLVVRVNGIGRGVVGESIFLTQEEALVALKKE